MLFSGRKEGVTVFWHCTAEAAAGLLAETVSTLAHIQAHPVIRDNRVYVTSHGNRMAAFNLYSGERLWERYIAGVQTPLIVGDVIFQITLNNQLAGINRIHGGLCWLKDLPKNSRFSRKGGWAGPILLQNRLYLTGVNGQVLAINPGICSAEPGKIEKIYTLSGGSSSFPPLVAQITPELLERAITPRSKWLILNSPNNPTGAVYTKEELWQKFCVPTPMFGFYQMIAMSILCTRVSVLRLWRPFVPRWRDGLSPLMVFQSKAYAMTGWRIGFAAGPVLLIQAMVTLQSQSTSNPCSISQSATVKALGSSPEQGPSPWQAQWLSQQRQLF